MPSSLRMLALLLALVSSVALPVLAAVGSAADCTDEDSDCADCSSCCTLCACCTLRSATLDSLPQEAIRRALELNVVVRLHEPVLAAVDPDIFQPPRA